MIFTGLCLFFVHFILKGFAVKLCSGSSFIRNVFCFVSCHFLAPQRYKTIVTITLRVSSLWTETFLVILTSQMMLVIHTLLRSLGYQKPASRVSSPLKSQLPQQGFITEALKEHNTVLIKMHREVKWQLNSILGTFKKEEKPCSVLKGCFSPETVKNTVMNTFYCNWIANINIKTTSELLNTSVKLWQPAKRSHQRLFQQHAAWIDFSQRPSLCVCVCVHVFMHH